MSDIRYCLSFDCADKTLGVCLLGYLPMDEINNRMEVIKDEEHYKMYYINQLTSDMLFIKQCWLFDLLPDAKVRETADYERLGRLKYALQIIKKYINSTIHLHEVDVEFQMGQNDLSRLISAAIIYEFCDAIRDINVIIGYNDQPQQPECNSSVEISVIMPAAKNSFHFHRDLSYGQIATKHKSNKTINKHHTDENMKYFIALYNACCCTEKKINIIGRYTATNHISDAFMQSVSRIIKKWINYC